jgi:hypothetical protein
VTGRGKRSRCRQDRCAKIWPPHQHSMHITAAQSHHVNSSLGTAPSPDSLVACIVSTEPSFAISQERGAGGRAGRQRQPTRRQTARGESGHVAQGRTPWGVGRKKEAGAGSGSKRSKNNKGAGACGWVVVQCSGVVKRVSSVKGVFGRAGSGRRERWGPGWERETQAA